MAEALHVPRDGAHGSADDLLVVPLLRCGWCAHAANLPVQPARVSMLASLSMTGLRRPSVYRKCVLPLGGWLVLRMAFAVALAGMVTLFMV